jgi:hypothetical protein
MIEEAGREGMNSLIGMHCSDVAIRNAMPLAPTKMIVIQAVTLNLHFIKIRN